MSIASFHWFLSAATLLSSSNPPTLLRSSPAFAASSLRVVKRHLGGRPRRPLRAGLTEMSSAVQRTTETTY